MNKVSQWVTTMASETPGSTVSLVGQGSILDKSSLHTVGCLGKNVDPSTAPEGGYCPVCEAKGQLQALRTYRINFTQSIYLCANPQCIYPLGYTPLDNIIANTADLKKRHSPGKKKKRHILDTCVTTNCVKKHKTDSFVSGEYISESLVSSPQIENYKSLFPCVPKESHASVPGPSEDIQEGRKQKYGMGGISLCNSATSPHGDRSTLVEFAQWDSSNQPGHLQKDFNEFHKGTVQNQIMGTAIASENVPSTLKLNVPATKDIYNLSHPENDINDPQPCINKKTEPGKAVVLNVDPKAEADIGSSLSVLGTCAPPVSPNLMHTALTVGHKQSDIPSSSYSGVCVEKAAPETPLLLNAAMFDSSNEKVLPEAASLFEIDFSETCSKIQDSKKCFGHLPSSTFVKENPPTEENDLKHISSSFSKNASFEKVEPKGVPLLEDNKGDALVVSSTGNQLSLINEMDNINTINNSLNSCLPTEMHHELPRDKNDLTVPCSASNVNAVGNDNNVKSLLEPPLPEVISTELSKNSSYSQSTSEPQVASIQQCNLSSEQKDEGIPLLQLSSSLHSQPTKEADCGNKIGHGSSLLNCEISDSYKTLNNQINSSPQAVKSMVTDMCNTNLCNNIDLNNGGKISLKETVPSCLQLEQCVLYSHTVSNPAVATRGAGPEFKVLDTSKEESGPICKDLNVCNVSPDVTPVNDSHDMSQNNVLTDLTNSLSSEITKVEESSDIAANSSSLSNRETSLSLFNTSSSPTHSEAQATANTVCTELRGHVLCNNSAIESIDLENAQVTICAHPEQSKLYNHGAEATVSTCLSHTAEEALQISGAPGMGCFPVFEEPPVVHDMNNINPPRASLDIMGSSDVDFGREKESNESFETDSSLMLTDDSIINPKDGESVFSLQKGSLEDGCPEVKSNCSENTSPSSMHKALNHSMENGSQDALCEKKLLQWRNTLFLCWLDCILSALVHSSGLKSIAAQRESAGNSVILNLLEKYNEANALIKSTAKRGRPKNLSLAENILNRVRMTIFEEIKPFLKCELGLAHTNRFREIRRPSESPRICFCGLTLKRAGKIIRGFRLSVIKEASSPPLGDKESPVFALPLLLQRDPEIESCFVHTGVWKFTCKLCGYQYQNKCKRTVTTFTKILPEWTPLNATHRSPCNKCLDTDQRRTFSIEKIHDIFILHFVEGLPSNDLGTYSFQFEGYLYEVRTVIKYREDHFSCWIAKEDGTWLESDDMKGYFCIKQNSFEVPASEMHMVMWERKATNGTGAHNTMAPEIEDKALNCLSSVSASQTLHQSAVAAPNAASKPSKETLNASNILSGMEGYHDDDIITLTLIEIPVDASGNVIDNNSEAAQQQPSAFVEQTPVTLQSVSCYIPTADGQYDQNSCSGTMQGSSFVGVPLPAPSRPSPPAPSRPSPPAPSRPSPPAPSRPSFPVPSEPILPTISSTPIPNRSSSKKAFIGSWMKSLQNKNPLFLEGNVPSANKKAPIRCPLLKTTDLQASNKQAQCFDGFKAKRVSNAVNSTNCHVVGPMKDSSTAPKPAVSSQTFQSLGSNRLKNGHIGIGSTKDLAKNLALSKEDKVRRLRLKLLKKLKAKKNELATLDLLGKSQAGSDSSSHPMELSSARRREQLRGFLQELQDQIDNADTESVCTMSSSTSLCSSPGDADFFAELFSPPPMSTEQDSMDDSRFLEMYVDGYSTNNPTSKEVAQSAVSISQSHPHPHTSDSHNSSNMGDVFHDMLSTSTVHMLNEQYFSPFDDLF